MAVGQLILKTRMVARSHGDLKQLEEMYFEDLQEGRNVWHPRYPHKRASQQMATLHLWDTMEASSSLTRKGRRCAAWKRFM